MAVAALSPWPTPDDAMALDEARASLSRAVGITGEDEVLLDRLGSTASYLVERYAAGAPQSIKNESVIRPCGWLIEQPSAPLRSIAVGDVSRAYATSSMSALRHSGSMAFLSPWKIRRAGVI